MQNSLTNFSCHKMQYITCTCFSEVLSVFTRQSTDKEICYQIFPTLKTKQNCVCVCVGGGGCLFVCVEVLWSSQPNGVMSRAVSLPNHMFTGQA